MSEHPQSAVRVPGLPPGVAPGPLGNRFVAHLIDSVVAGLIGGLTSVSVWYTNISLDVITVVSTILILAWALLIWWMFAVRAAGPGMRLMHLQLVGLANGRPIGWGRFFLRQLILLALGATGVGLILMLVFLVMHPRRQGWHDLAVNAVVIKERRRTSAPAESRTVAVDEQSTGRSTAEQPAVAPPVSSSSSAAVAPSSAASPVQPLTPPPGYAVPPRSAPSPQPAAVPPPVAAPQPTASPGPAPLVPPTGQTAPVARPADVPAQASPSAVPLQPVDTDRVPPVGVPAAGATASDPSGAGPQSTQTPGFPVPTSWRAVLDDGRELVIDGLVLLGRNPQPRPGEEHATLIKIADTTRTVSKSHLEVGLNSSGLYVIDRGSTNGSTVTGTSGVTKRCAPGDPVQVESGSIVSLGDHWLEVKQG